MDEKTKILVVDDEPAIRRMVGDVLSRNGYQCFEVADAAQAKAAVATFQPHLILLDWMMPGQSGIEFARNLKRGAGTRKIPIIMLTALDDEGEKVHGLTTGADDYVTKPFSPRELVARIGAVLRRAGMDEGEGILESDGLVLNVTSHRVTANGHDVALGPTEFRLLHFLMSHMERVYSRAQLLDGVWGRNAYLEERTVDVHIRRLRKVLGSTGHDRLVQTVRGTGYRFSA